MYCHVFPIVFKGKQLCEFYLLSLKNETLPKEGGLLLMEKMPQEEQFFKRVQVLQELRLVEKIGQNENGRVAS